MPEIRMKDMPECLHVVTHGAALWLRL